MNEGTRVMPQKGIAKMQEVSGETGQVGGGASWHAAGVYRHPATGAEIIALDDRYSGDAQARGYVRAGFEWVRDAKEGEVKSVGVPPSEDFASKPERKLESDSEELKGIRARLNALESENAKLREQGNAPVPESPTEESQQHAQAAAEQKTEERGTDNSGDVAAKGGVNAPVTETKKKEGK